jgi:hypothetical protein
MTTSWWQMDWVWEATEWVLCAIGVGVLGWALFWDRAKGRRRCPECWYDMKGVPGLKCPECGREAKRERRLGKTRRRWRWAATGLLMLLAGGAGAIGPRVKRDGWMGLVPTTVVILMLPQAAEDVGNIKVLTRSQNPFAEEMCRRVASRGMWDWQWRWAITRTGVFRTRAEWTRGADVMVELWGAEWLPSLSVRATVLAQTGATLRADGSGSWAGPACRVAAASRHSEVEEMLKKGPLRLSVQVDGAHGWVGAISLPTRIVPAD